MGSVRWKRMAAVGIGLVSAAVVLAACSSGTPVAKANPGEAVKGHVALKRVDWANITDAGSLQVAIQSGIQYAGGKLGVHVATYNNNASSSTALQNAHLMTLNNPQVIADFNISATTNRALGKVFSNAKTPCVGVDIQMPGCTWLQLNNGAAGLDAGPIAAGIVKKKGWTGANTTVIGLTTWSTGAFVNGIVTDFYQSFAQNMPGMIQKDAVSFGPSTTKIGSSYVGLDCGLVPGPCQSAVSEALAAIPASRHLMFIGLNDQVVQAGLAAANSAGRRANAAGVGLGDGASINLLRTDPQWIAEDDIFYHGWGEYLMAVSSDLINGVKPANDTAVIPSLVITKSQVDKYYGASGTSAKLLPPVPVQDKYLVRSGVLQQFHNISGLS